MLFPNKNHPMERFLNVLKNFPLIYYTDNNYSHSILNYIGCGLIKYFKNFTLIYYTDKDNLYSILN